MGKTLEINIYNSDNEKLNERESDNDVYVLNVTSEKLYEKIVRFYKYIVKPNKYENIKFTNLNHADGEQIKNVLDFIINKNIPNEIGKVIIAKKGKPEIINKLKQIKTIILDYQGPLPKGVPKILWGFSDGTVCLNGLKEIDDEFVKGIDKTNCKVIEIEGINEISDDHLKELLSIGNRKILRLNIKKPTRKNLETIRNKFKNNAKALILELWVSKTLEKKPTNDVNNPCYNIYKDLEELSKNNTNSFTLRPNIYNKEGENKASVSAETNEGSMESDIDQETKKNNKILTFFNKLFNKKKKPPTITTTDDKINQIIEDGKYITLDNKDPFSGNFIDYFSDIIKSVDKLKDKNKISINHIKPKETRKQIKIREINKKSYLRKTALYRFSKKRIMFVNKSEWTTIKDVERYFSDDDYIKFDNTSLKEKRNIITQHNIKINKIQQLLEPSTDKIPAEEVKKKKEAIISTLTNQKEITEIIFRDKLFNKDKDKELKSAFLENLDYAIGMVNLGTSSVVDMNNITEIKREFNKAKKPLDFAENVINILNNNQSNQLKEKIEHIKDVLKLEPLYKVENIDALLINIKEIIERSKDVIKIKKEDVNELEELWKDKGNVLKNKEFVKIIKNNITTRTGKQLLENLNGLFNEKYNATIDSKTNNFKQVIEHISISLKESEAEDLNLLPQKITDFKKEIEELRKQPDINEISKSLNKSVIIPDSLEDEININSKDYERVGSYKQLVNRNNEYLNLIKELEEVIVNAEYKSIDKLSWNTSLGFIIEGYRNYFRFANAIKTPYMRLIKTLESSTSRVSFTKEFEKELLKNLFELAIVAKDQALITTEFFKPHKEGKKHGTITLSVDIAKNNYRFLTELNKRNMLVVRGSNDEDIIYIIKEINKKIDSYYRKIKIYKNENEDIATINLVYLAYKLGIKNLDVLVNGHFIAKQLTEYNLPKPGEEE